jgi:hypothetical protein
MIEYEKAYRQGEILIFKVKEFPHSYKKPKHVPNGVIREGEKEGHEHKVEAAKNQQSLFELSMFDGADEGQLKADSTVTITHPEHKPIKLPKGKYVVKVQKEATGKNTHQSVKD